MKKNVKWIISIVIIVLMIASGLFYLVRLTERKNSYEKYAAFFGQEEDFDVLFFGTSHVINGIYPMELWNSYGIVSYNFGGHANKLAITYWVMENALEYTTPRLVVIDCHGLQADEKIYNLEYLHLSLDAFPLNQTKLQAVCDLVSDGQQRMSLLWNFSTYHNRWAELTEDDFKPQPTATKGAETRVNVAVPNEVVYLDSSQRATASSVSIEYLERMIEDCQARGIEVLLTYLPYPATEEQQETANHVFDIAEKYQIEYLDYYTLASQVDFSVDCYDADSHLNASGAKKVTAYVGQYIMEHFDIPDQRENEAYSSWNDDYEAYKELKISHIKAQIAADNYLMLLYDQSFSSCIYLSGTADLEKSEIEWKLLKNLGIPDTMLQKHEASLIMLDQLDGSISCVHLNEELESVFGTLRLQEADGDYQITIDQEPVLTIEKDHNAAFLVFDNDTKELLVQTICIDSTEPAAVWQIEAAEEDHILIE